MNRTPIVLGGMLIALLALSGCDTITDLMGGGGGAEAFAEGEALLRQGDLPAAADRWEEAQVTNPGDVDAATGAAFSLLLKGDTEAADAALAAAEGKAGERLSELKMRRALVALEAGDLDQVRSHAIASGLPAGKLLAAEVAMADGETDEALELLEEASGSGGSVGRLASDYMARLSDEDSMVSGLCEAEALWALGVRKVAVKSADELVRGLPEDREDKPALLLTWAGRAVSVQEAEIAQGLLDPLTFPPEGLKWRMDAVQAMVYCVQGDIETCEAGFEKLDRTGPATGVADARATAAYLIAEENPEAAKALVGSLQSNAAARALLATGDGTAAQNASPGGVIDNYLASGG